MINDIQYQSLHLAKPENYYRGKCLPENFALPDNILMFYHDWIYPGVQAHARHMLIIPFKEVIYFVDQSRVDLNPGFGLFLLPHQSHYLQADNTDQAHDRLFITFELSSPQSYLPSAPLTGFTDAAWQSTARLLRDYQKQDVLGTALELTHLLRELSNHSCCIESQRISAVTSDAIRFINHHIGKPFDNQAIADHLKISASNLRLIFRRDMNISLGRYIANQRLNAAKHRLRSTTLSVAAIALSCGFDSIYAFSHFFKHNTGVSPLQFRHRRENTVPAPGDAARPEEEKS